MTQRITPPRADDQVDRWRQKVCQHVNQDDFIINERVMFTSIGGYAVKLTNKTGAATIKGTVVEVDTTEDEAVAIATSPYVVQGFFYEDGVADGEKAWVVISGIADVLLQDNLASFRGHWGRLSSTQAGRADFSQDLPGYETGADSVAYTTGSTVSGTIANTASDDGVYLVQSEATGTPGLDATFTFTTDELLPSVFFNGYYTGNHAASIVCYPWDYTASGGAGGWDTALPLFTMSLSGVADEDLSFTGLQEKHFDSGAQEMKLRFYHANPGNTSHRIYIDKLVLGATASVEHFKEIGHSLQDVAAGTDKLCRINIHLL